jgi:hypothetical protein
MIALLIALGGLVILVLIVRTIARALRGTARGIDAGAELLKRHAFETDAAGRSRAKRLSIRKQVIVGLVVGVIVAAVLLAILIANEP